MTTNAVEFQPLGRRGRCRDDESLMDCARGLGIGLSAICGGAGTCYSCKLRVAAGAVSEPTDRERDAFSAEELAAGWRLACQTYPRGDCSLSVPPESMTAPQRTQTEGIETAVTPAAAVGGANLALSPPTLADPRADADRLLAALAAAGDATAAVSDVPPRRIDLAVLRGLPSRLRDLEWQCRAYFRGDTGDNGAVVIGIAPPSDNLLGLAIDAGTTKLAGYLVDLATGRTLAARGVMNPQIECGEDVVTRVGHAATEDGRDHLQRLLVTAINQLANDLCGEAGVSPQEIVDVVAVGNTAIHHFLLGLPTNRLVVSPFIPAAAGAIDVRARDLGLEVAPGAYLHLPPNIAGFVGADHVAMLLATGVWQDRGPALAIDIGTNTEVSLIIDGAITSVSCASGPAFEGGHIRDGMRAAPGAIERVRIVNGGRTATDVQYQTVDDAPPVGICGSGILDAIAQLRLAGIVGEEGRMTADHPLVRGDNRQRHFVLASNDEGAGSALVVVTQKDVRELQLAKAAIRAGIQALLEANDCRDDEIRRVIIAGAFGSYIDVASAIEIGMLPVLPRQCFEQVGNAAGSGARLALISTAKREEATEIAGRVRYLELAGSAGFTETFTEATYLGRYRLRDGRRQAIG